MDALMLALLALAITGFGDRPAQIAADVAGLHPRRRRDIFLAFVAAAALNCLLAVLAGAVLHDVMAPRARGLLLGLAVAGAGAGMMWNRRAPPLSLLVRRRPAAGTALLAGTAMIGDKGQFILGAAAAWSGSAALAFAGGLAGLVAAGAGSLFLARAGWPDWLLPVRRLFAVILLLAGLAAALSSVGLIG